MREALTFTLEDVALTEEERAMSTRLILHTPTDAYSALKDLADILDFVQQALDQSQARRNGTELEFTAPAVAGCATMLECLVQAFHDIA